MSKKNKKTRKKTSMGQKDVPMAQEKMDRDALGGEILKPSKETKQLLEDIWRNVVLFQPADESKIGPKSLQKQIAVAILMNVLKYPEGREIFGDLRKEGTKFYFTFDGDTTRHESTFAGPA